MFVRGVLTFLLVVVGVEAAAMTVPPLSAAELAARADQVVDGRVVSAHARWIGRRIVTFYVVEQGKGGRMERTLVAVPGGVVGNLAQHVPGAPVLEVGRLYRLHLGPPDGPRARDSGEAGRGIIGFHRGVQRIDDVGGRRVFVPFTEAGRADGWHP
jgi:hypothetical protein